MLQILYFVYKNVAFGLTLFFYDILTTSSGQVLFDDWYIVIFNVLLTSLPVISLGVLEQDVSYEVCLKVKKSRTCTKCNSLQWFFIKNLITLLMFVIGEVSNPLSTRTKEYLLQLETNHRMDTKRIVYITSNLYNLH